MLIRFSRLSRLIRPVIRVILNIRFQSALLLRVLELFFVNFSIYFVRSYTLTLNKFMCLNFAISSFCFLTSILIMIMSIILSLLLLFYDHNSATKYSNVFCLPFIFLASCYTGLRAILLVKKAIATPSVRPQLLQLGDSTVHLTLSS